MTGIRRAARPLGTLLLVPFLLAACRPAAAGGPAGTEPAVGPPPAAAWAEVDRLLGEQKLAEAAKRVAALEAAARERGDDRELARALVRSTQIALALGGFESAVESLRAAAWPEETLARATVELYFAHALMAYLDGYGWEIAQRERVVGGGELDLRLWTRDQIAAEADRAFARVWALRADLGELPAGELDLLRPNDYPEGIRPTLRDALSHLWAARLADASHWSPAELEELWKLDLAALVAGSPIEATPERLAEAGLHPLVRLSAILGDLERWHRSGGRAGAALEARLERLRILHDAHGAPEDRARIRTALAESLAEFRREPWWSMGMARLASFWRQAPEPDALVRARAVALEGEAGNPGSPGALACRREREEIEAPELSLQSMAIDAGRRRSIQIEHRNVERLHFRAYRLEDVAFESRPVAWEGWTDERIRPLLRGEAAASWQVDLPPTEDYRSHRSFTTPPLEALGRWLIVASPAPGFGERGNQLQAVELRLGDLVVLRGAPASAGRSLVLHALSGSTGRPVAGAEVRLYRWEWERRPELVGRTTTDGDGLARLEPPGDGRRGGGFSVVVRHAGEEAVWQQGWWPWQRGRAPEPGVGSLVFTDRSIYRPGQRLLWKTLVFDGEREEGRLRAAAGRELELRLVDPNGEAVATAKATTNRFGTASGELAIPAGRLLGDWRLETSLGGAAPVAVEEYKRPTFEVVLDRPTREARLGRPVEVVGRGRYYFGLPVAAGSVAWRVVREPIWEWGWRSWWAPPAPPRTIASGTAVPGPDGEFTITFTAEADERESDRPGACGCFRFRVEAELVDEGGETRTGTLALALGWTAVRLALEEEPFLLRAGRADEWRLRREDLDGTPRPGETAWRIVRLVEPERAPLPAELPLEVEPARERYATAGDRQRPRWAEAPSSEEILAGWPAGPQVAAGEARHDERGRAELALPALEPGAYRLVAETRDAHGEPATLERGFVVAGPRVGPALPLELRFEEPTVEPGGKARLFVHSGVAGASILLEIVRGDEVRARRRLPAGDPAWIEIPVDEGERGGFGARAALVADHQVVQRTAAVAVPWNDKGLELELSSFRDELAPGATEAFRVTVRGADGEPLGAGAAELLASMYDRSLDAFRPRTVPSIAALYPSFGAPGPLEHELGGRGAVWAGGTGRQSWTEPPSYSPDAFVAIDPYGVGGPGARGRLMMMRGAVAESVAVDGVAAKPAAAPAPQARDAAQSKELAAVGDVGGAPPPPPPPPPVTPRTDFSETAFWRPHLVTDERGGAAIEFRVPESLTSWKLWVAAWTRELASGYLEREVRTAKDLMVRPYLPRFLREGDRAELRVVVQNAGDEPLAGELRFAVVDPETGDDLSAALGLPAGGGVARFDVEPGRGDTHRFEVVAPRGARPLAVRVEARSGALADGERRALPLLPSRLRLAQSRFAALRDGERRELVFDDLRRDDPTRIDEQLVVTVDGQLFHGLLDALPYLVDYPYECTEQTLNKFVSTAILGSLFDRYPEVARAAAEMAERETRWEPFDGADPNRRTALEETPWLREARGGGEGSEAAPLLRVLDPRVARAVRADSLAELERAQLPSGAFPWFPGGPPSPYMTLYLLAGFARVAEFGGEIPLEMVERGWRYLAGEIEREWWRDALRDDCCWELLTFANYVASSYPDPSVLGDVLPEAERRRILDFSFRHWKEHAPVSKLQLAMTLARMDEPAKAKLVIDALFDSAKSDRDLGTYWQPEERSWLWYNDTIESHAWALRALSEVAPGDPRREGLVQWLFLQKKLGHWKSTRATAEVLYSVAHYLRDEERLAVAEAVDVTVGGRTTELRFDPDRFTGRRARIVLTGDEIVPERDATVVVAPRTRALGFASATWHYSTERLPEASSGDLFAVERRWFRRARQGREATLTPLAEGERLAVGDEIEVQLSLRARAAAEYVHLRDPRPAGLEPDRAESGWRWDLGLARYEETRDSGTSFFFERLPAGEYTLRYRLRAAVAGTFRAAPAELQSMYAPEFTAHSAGAELEIAP